MPDTTIEDIMAKVPPAFRPVVAKYGPALVNMTAEELWAWIELLLAGRTFEAWQNVIGRLDNADLLDAWQDAGRKWDEANERNAASLRLQREAALAVLRALLTAALALVGL